MMSDQVPPARATRGRAEHGAKAGGTQKIFVSKRACLFPTKFYLVGDYKNEVVRRKIMFILIFSFTLVCFGLLLLYPFLENSEPQQRKHVKSWGERYIDAMHKEK